MIISINNLLQTFITMFWLHFLKDSSHFLLSIIPLSIQKWFIFVQMVPTCLNCYKIDWTKHSGCKWSNSLVDFSFSFLANIKISKWSEIMNRKIALWGPINLSLFLFLLQKLWAVMKDWTASILWAVLSLII